MNEEEREQIGILVEYVQQLHAIIAGIAAAVSQLPEAANIDIAKATEIGEILAKGVPEPQRVFASAAIQEITGFAKQLKD